MGYVALLIFCFAMVCVDSVFGLSQVNSYMKDRAVAGTGVDWTLIAVNGSTVNGTSAPDGKVFVCSLPINTNRTYAKSKCTEMIKNKTLKALPSVDNNSLKTNYFPTKAVPYAGDANIFWYVNKPTGCTLDREFYHVFQTGEDQYDYGISITKGRSSHLGKNFEDIKLSLGDKVNSKENCVKVQLMLPVNDERCNVLTHVIFKVEALGYYKDCPTCNRTSNAVVNKTVTYTKIFTKKDAQADDMWKCFTAEQAMAPNTFVNESGKTWMVSKTTLTGAALVSIDGVHDGLGKEESLLIPASGGDGNGGGGDGGGHSGGNVFRVDLMLVFVSTFVVLVLGNMG